jgi:phosphohistidine phosphatase
MELYLLRHAPAEIQGDTWKGTDKNRPLSRKGVKKMRKMVAAMKHLHLTFDLILTSPYRRARETAELAAKKIRHPHAVRVSKHLKVGGNSRMLIREIVTGYGHCERVLLVGHEPGLSRLISVLLSGKQSLVITMKKGGICKLTTPGLRYGRCASLEWLIGPAELLDA